MSLNIVGLDHVVLRVADIERSTAFYCGLLGCREERTVAEIGLVQLRAGNSLIDLVPAAGKRTASTANMDHFCLQVAALDIAELQKYLDAQGVEYGELSRRYGATGFGPSIYIIDPDGNTVELKGPADGQG